MAKLTSTQKKWLQTHKGKKNKEKRYGYTWSTKRKRWEKRKYHITPKVTPPPKPVTPPKTTPPVVVKTNHPVTPELAGAGAATLTYITQAEMQREYAGMVAIELWQYLNAEAVDGIFNNVKLMTELTEVRSSYNPNDIMTSYTPLIKSVRRTPANILEIEIDGEVFGRHMLLEFFIANTELIITGDYA